MADGKFIQCPHCGAKCLNDATKCWLCHGSLIFEDVTVVSANPFADPKLAPEPSPKSSLSEWFFMISTIAVVLVLALVGIGVAQDSPGGLVLFGIVVVPALLITFLRNSQPAERNQTWAMRFTTLMSSLFMTIGVILALWLAIMVALFVVCLVVISGMRFH